MVWLTQKKYFPITVHGPLPPLIYLTGDSMDFFFTPLNNYLCCQPFQRDLPHLHPNPLTFQKNTSTVESWYAPQNDFLFPMSARRQQHADSWHHNSLCLCQKRLQRAGEKLSPYFTIETCQWNYHQHWQVAREFVFCFFYFTLFYKTGFWFQDTCTVPCPLLEVTLLPSVRIWWIFPRPFPSFITVTSFKEKI